jgi:SAM-dependent methyltransferase
MDVKILDRKDYILKWEPLLERHIGRYCTPDKRRVLIVGCGMGTEIVWALRHGAGFVTGCDPRGYDDRALREAIKETAGEAALDNYEMIKGTTENVPPKSPYHLIVSMNVFEHVFDLSRNLSAMRRLMKKGSRVVLFTAPLFYSANGSHLHLEPWCHLTENQESLKARVHPYLWNDYRTGLNGMTISTFLDAVREAGMILLNMHTLVDRETVNFGKYADALPPSIKPLDLCLEGFGAELTFPEFF